MRPTIFAVCVLANVAFADQGVDGRVVSATTGAAIPGVAVSLLQSWKSAYSATTDADGYFRIDGVKAGLPIRLSPHSFRVTTITDLLEQGIPLEDVQRLAGHADPRTTRLYDRRDKKITRNIVERISI